MVAGRAHHPLVPVDHLRVQAPPPAEAKTKSKKAREVTPDLRIGLSIAPTEVVSHVRSCRASFLQQRLSSRCIRSRCGSKSASIAASCSTRVAIADVIGVTAPSALKWCESEPVPQCTFCGVRGTRIIDRTDRWTKRDPSQDTGPRSCQSIVQPPTPQQKRTVVIPRSESCHRRPGRGRCSTQNRGTTSPEGG